MDQSFSATFEPLHPDVVLPSRATQGSAGYDVRAYLTGRTVQTYRGTKEEVVSIAGESLTLEPGVRALIPLGFRAKLPRGIEGQLRLRSSIALRRGLVMPNAPATVDSDYPGEWLVIVTNTLAEPVEIEHLERIAQIVFNRVEVVDWTRGEVTASSERTGGFGSTGR